MFAVLEVLEFQNIVLVFEIDFLSFVNTVKIIIMAGDNDTLAILAKSISNLLKKDSINKPTQFSSSTGLICKHLDTVKSFCTFIEARSEAEMAMVLWDTLEDSVKHEIIFDSQYDAKKDSFEWLSDKLKRMFPSKTNKTTELIELNKIKQNDRSLKDYCSLVKHLLL